MLTKDLLRVRSSGQYLKPQFLTTDDPALLNLASDFIGIYENGIGERAEVLDETANAVVLKERDLKLARGLLKVVRSRAEFSGADDTFPYAEARAALFKRTAERLKTGDLPEDVTLVRDTVFSAESDSPMREHGIYADLPENERLIRFRKTFPQEALDRYNIGLVQGLLLFSGGLELTIPAATPPADLRNLFRSMRFFRLLFRGELKNGNLHLRVDGPASVLENSLKYGLQLACFFPSVCRLPQWKLSAVIRRNGKDAKLLLSHENGLKSYRAQFTGSLEEHRMFLQYFRTQNTGWIIDDAPGYLSPEPQNVIFPDFSFYSETSGETKYLELFHRWHASQLEDRLKWCEAHPDNGLLLGIDRSLLKKDGLLKERLADSAYFQVHGFLFRDFPGTENVLKLLNRQKQ